MGRSELFSGVVDGTGSPDEYFFTVLSVHEEVISKFTGCLFKEQNKYVSACFLENMFQEPRQNCCPSISSLPLVVSVFASLLLVNFLQCIYNSRLTERFSDHRRLPVQSRNRRCRVSEEGY
jgi:hypothetical protein